MFPRVDTDRQPDPTGQEIEAGEHEPRLDRDRRSRIDGCMGVREMCAAEQKGGKDECRPDADGACDHAEDHQARKQLLQQSGAQCLANVVREVRLSAGRDLIVSRQPKPARDKRHQHDAQRHAASKFSRHPPERQLLAPAVLKPPDKTDICAIGEHNRNECDPSSSVGFGATLRTID